MQSLKQDLERAMGTSKRSYSSILEAIGVDIDTKEMSEPLSVVFSSAVNEISQAGQQIRTPTNLNINVLDENVILDLSATSVAFNLTLSANRSIPDNGTAIFQFISGQIGKYTIAHGNASYLNQLLIYQRSKKSFNSKANAMLMDLRPHNSLLGSAITAAQELIFVEPSGVLGADPGSINGSTITPMHQQTLKKREYQIYRQASYNADARQSTYRVVIPLTELCPNLQQFPDHQLYLGLGQFLNLQFQVNPPELWSTAMPFATNIDAANDRWEISNMQLIKVYTKLPDPMVQLILKSVIPMQKRDFYAQTQALSPTMSFNMTVPKQARLKALHIGFFWKNAAIFTPTAANQTKVGDGLARFFKADVNGAGTLSSFKAPLNYFPAFHKYLTFVQISVSGVVRNYNAQQLQLLWDAEGILSGSDRLLEDNPYLQPFKAPFKIPLDRISKEDLIGSSSGSDQTVVQVTLQFTANPAQFILPERRISETGDDGDYLSTIMQQFTSHIFLEYKSEMALANGFYEVR